MNAIRKYLIPALICVLSSFPAYAQLTAENAFASAPQAIFPLLDKNTRLDMIDYYLSGSDTPSKNRLDGKSRISAMTGDDIKIAMTDASTYQLAILPAGTDSIIAVITTVATPAHDSHIAFYDRSWKKLPDTYFTAPTMSDWLNDEGKKSPDTVTVMVPFMLTEYVYDPESKTLSLINNLKEFMSVDTESMVSPYLLPSLVYVWDGKKFEKSK
ncbi:MAG: DUF3256 family protein [Muribaculum sp.]|nr:DUF3256 family protein [Muribaculum sp.]